MKLRFRILFYFIPLIILFHSCGSEVEVEDIEVQGKVIVYEVEEHQKAIQQELSYLQTDSGFYYMEWMDTLSKYYTNRSFQPIWAEITTDTMQFESWLQFMNKESMAEGLYPQWYGLEHIKEYHNELLIDDQWNYSAMASIDIALSLSMMHLQKDHVLGRVKPNEVFGSQYHLPLRKHENFKWLAILNASKYDKIFYESSLIDSLYLKYKSTLQQLIQLKRDSVQWERIDFDTIAKIEPGMKTKLVPSMAHKLIALSLMDTSQWTLVDSSIYTAAFSKIVKRMQKEFGLSSDGIMGQQSMEAINISIDGRVESLMSNMERIRWFSEPKGESYVLVNLPGYSLTMQYEDSFKNMAICIGKSKAANYAEQWDKYEKSKKWYHKPKNHETPQIYSKIRYMVLNPTWTVPKSIVRREMYWRMRRDSTYLRRNNYRVYLGKQELFPDTINWKKYNPLRIPFKFVQVEGESNALGRVKYIFPNPYSIFLHDTPLKSKFKINQRAVSHGCVRLAEPFEMAKFLLHDNPRVNYDDVRIKMGMEPLDIERLAQYDPMDSMAKIQKIDSTEVIYLHKPIPVYFIYRTIYYDQNDKVVYRYDMYRKNNALFKAMERTGIIK